MIDNLRRSLLSPSLFMILLLALTILPGSPFRWIAIVILTWFLPVTSPISYSYQSLSIQKVCCLHSGQVFVTIVTLPFQIFCCSMLLVEPCTVYSFLKVGCLNGLQRPRLNARAIKKEAPVTFRNDRRLFSYYAVFSCDDF